MTLFIAFIIFLLPTQLHSLLTWQSAPNLLPIGISEGCTATINDEIIYSFGGRVNNVPQAVAWKYDTSASIGWQSISVTIPSGMFCGVPSKGIVIQNNMIYFFGPGYNTGSIYAFDVNTESFIAHNIPANPNAAGSTAMDTKNNKIFLIGGASLQILDLNTNQWETNIAALPNGYSFGGTALYFDANTQNLFTFGGYGSSGFINHIWRYSVPNNEWNILSVTLSESKGNVASILANDGNVYLFGGYTGGSSYHSKVDAFDVTDWTIMQLNNLPQARADMITTLIDNSIIFWGGNDASNYYNYGYMTQELLPDSTCEQDGEIKHINWNELQNAMDNTAEIPYSSFNIYLDNNTLTMIFDIDLEYIGNSSDGNFDLEYNLGTTYVVGFDSFGTSGNLINEPGNCQNRLSSSFVGVTDFNNYWDYSEYPYLNDLGSNTYLSYPPPSEYWTLSIDAFTCSPINYYAIFSWNDLSQCTDFNGNNLIDIIDDGTSITLSGTLYVSVVSPYSMGIVDSGIYRTFSLIQQDFEISLLKQINVLSSTGIDLFITSIIGIYEDETDQSFELSVFTQTADYMQLINPSILTTPLQLGTAASISSVTSSCLSASTYSCGQIFTITINQTEISCPPADFSGIYSMSFDVDCRFNEPVCNIFINDNGGSPTIGLQVESNFIDNYCEPEIYLIIFDGNMTFFDDNTFLIVHNELSENYVIGQDIIYIEIEVDFPDDGSGDNYNIFNVVIDNVFVCTADDQYDLTHNLNQQNGIGGCLSVDVDVDGEYIIIENGVEYDDNAQIIQHDSETNVVRFSFLTFDIGRTTMYVHAQLTLELINESGRRRILSASTSNQIRHFISSTSIINQETNVFVTQYIDDSTENDNSDGSLNKLMASTTTIKILFLLISSMTVYILS